MSSPTVATLADAVTTEINAPARSWNEVYGALAERTWYPVKSLDPTSGLPQLTAAAVLSVVPDSVPEKVRMTRPKSDGTPSLQSEKHVLFFLLQQKVADVTPAVVDPLVLLLEQVTDYFFADGHFVAVGSGIRAKCVEARIEGYCVREDLEEQRAYVGCSSLTFEVVR